MNFGTAILTIIVAYIIALRCVGAYMITRPPAEREVYVGELADIRYSGDGDSDSSTTFVFENGSVVPVWGIKRGLAVGDNVILIVRGTRMCELVVNPESLEEARG